MNNDTRKYLAETYRLIAVGQLAAFGYAAVNADPVRWGVIAVSVVAAVVFIAVGVHLMTTLEEKS